MDEKLHKAIQNGQVSEAERLLQLGANINYLFGMKGTPLCAAIYADKPEIVDILVARNCDLNAKDYDGEPPLCLAIRLEKYHLVERLLAITNCDVNKIDPITGNRPIHVAIKNGSLDTVQRLIQRNCLLNASDREGNTPLTTAIVNKQKGIAKFLLECDCDMLATDSLGDIPLHTSVKASDTDILCKILDKIDVNGTIETSKYKGIIDYPSKAYQDTPLIRAINTENMEAAYELIKRGCNVNLANFHGETALYLACKNNFQDMAVSLLEAGADPNSVTERKGQYHLSTKVIQQSPLREAIALGNLFLVQKLLEFGADLNLLDSSGNSPLCIAFHRNKPQIAEYILNYASEHRIPLFDIYNSSTSKATHPLLAVASCTNPAYFAKKLIDLGCDVNYTQMYGNEVCCPILNAIEFECCELLEVLLEHGADTEILNPYQTPLQVAASEGCLATAAALIQWGAEINAKSSSGSSALDYALSNGNIEVAEMLLICGCQVDMDALDMEEYSLEMFCTDQQIEMLTAMVLSNAQNPLPLAFICRNTIKDCLKRSGKSLQEVQRLKELPNKLKDYVRHKELDKFKHCAI